MRSKGKGRAVELAQEDSDGDAISRPPSAASAGSQSTIGMAALERDIAEDEARAAEESERARRELEAMNVAEDEEEEVEVEEQEREEEEESGSSDDDDDDDEEASEDDEPPIDEAILAQLADETVCRQWKQCHIELAELDLKVDQIVRLNGGKDWLGEVKDMRSLNSQMQPLVDDDGVPLLTAKNKPRWAVNTIYIQNAWMYSATDLKKLKNDSRIHPKLKFMGSREWVTTDLLDWHRQVDVVGLCKPVFDFDDRYPTPSANVSHPLSFRPLSKHQDPLLEPPPYFFGDMGDSGAKTDAIYNTDNDAKYVRVHFNFLGPAVATGKGKGKGAAKKAQSQGTKVITFNPHSTSKTPYCAKFVQHYSRSSKTWYHVADLLKKKSFGPAVTDEGAASSDDGDGTDYDREPGSANGKNKKRRAVKPAPRKPAKKQKAREEVAEGPVAELEALAKKPVVRGGAYGLIEILELDPTLEAEEYAEEGEHLVAAAAEWIAIVERRTKGGLERGLAPGGGQWLCPDSGLPI
ncbi:hypothetical protein RQP46_006914 [Phenoliferia psychrophenolica]